MVPGVRYIREAAEQVPQYDSNSTAAVCQWFLGLAGVFALVALLPMEASLSWTILSIKVGHVKVGRSRN